MDGIKIDVKVYFHSALTGRCGGSQLKQYVLSMASSRRDWGVLVVVFAGKYGGSALERDLLFMALEDRATVREKYQEKQAAQSYGSGGVSTI